MKRGYLAKAEMRTIAAIEEGAQTLADGRALMDRFRSIVRRKAEADLVLLDA